MRSVRPVAGPDAELAPAAALFRGLADPTRLTILRRLSLGEARVADLTAEMGLAQSTISSHLSCLRDCGLITGRPEGRQMFYAVTYPELLDLLSAAETLLAVAGDAVALCPTYGTDSNSGSNSTGTCGDDCAGDLDVTR